MATIRAFTTIEQSRRLAEILPLESADMCYLQENGQAKTISPSKLSEILSVSKPQVIPCWSLASLLSFIDFPSLTQEGENKWEVCVLDHKNDGYVETTGDNPIDACVAMVEKLHELNLL